MHNPNILISVTDHALLRQLVGSARFDMRIPSANVSALEVELARATIVSPEELPEDVVTMGSTIWFRDLHNDEFEEYTLVVPAEADIVRGRISVLAPIGTALLGYRLGDVVEWRVPSGKRRMEIVKVDQQHDTCTGLAAAGA